MTPRRRLVLSMATFVMLGMPPAAFGVAWPSVAGTFDRPLGDLGTLVAAYGFGYFAITTGSGHMIERVGVGALLSASGWLGALSLLGYAMAPSWAPLVVAAATLGLAGGLIDTAINSYAALEMNARAMNLLHAAYGVGAGIGPVIMTVLVTAEAGRWRLGMALIAGCTAVVAIAITSTRGGWQLSDVAHDDSEIGAAPPPVVTAALVMFLVYTGIEVVAGQYAFTLLSEGRGVPAPIAGLAAGGFWIGLTSSRAALGLIGDRLRPRTVLTVSTVAAAICLSLIWPVPGIWAAPVLLVLAGVGLGPFFPLHIALTPSRMGRRHTTRMVGYQIAAAHLGAATIPWLTGRAVNAAGLGVIGVVFVAGSALMLAADGILSLMVKLRPVASEGAGR